MTHPTTSPDGLPYETLTGQEPTSTLNGGSPGTDPILAIKTQDAINSVRTDIAAASSRIDAVEEFVLPNTGYAIFTPSVVGGGSVSFSTGPTGRWRLISEETVHFIVYFVVGTAGSGTSNIQIGDMPLPINRALRQIAQANIEGAPTPSLRMGHLVAFTGGADPFLWDRCRFQRGDDFAALANLTGADLVSGLIFTAQGIFQEETD